MKECPRCGSIYSDDSLNFCLTDGTALIPSSDGDDTPTIIRDHRTVPEIPAIRKQGGVSPVFKYLTVALAVFIMLLGIAGFGVWSLWNSRDPVVKISNTAVQTPTAQPSTPGPVPAKNTVAEPTPSATTNTRRMPTPTPSTQTPENDAGTTRITFRRGRISETLKGVVSERRSFVLRTVNGQRLVASVDSPGNCVSIQGGSDSFEITTPSGDVGITVLNDCDRPSPFTLSVTVR